MTGILGLIGLIVPMTVHPAAVVPVPAPQQQQAPADERTASPQLQQPQRTCVITHDDKARAFQVVCR
ncbi:MAG: hypothetical protein ACJ8EL_01595 [Rhizomicrobium sp.]|jgi:hypothetical protein